MVSGENSPREPFDGCGFSTHAEMAALKHLQRSSLTVNKYWHKKKITVDLIVLCVTKTGKLRMSKPCSHCVAKLVKCDNVKIKNVYYSDREMGITRITFSKLTKSETYVSRAFR